MDFNRNKIYPRSLYTLGILFFIAQGLWSQNLETLPQASSDSISAPSLVDMKYREDQFYFGLTFNFMSDMPKGVSQSGFSGGLHLGFIRDFPLNQQRNFGLGVGLGWSINSFRSNLLISENEDGRTIFQVLDKDSYDFKFSRFATQLIEVPFEIRWRNSQATDYKFWRVYAGLKLGYIYHFRSNFKQPEKHIKLNHADGLHKLRYGLTFTFGYNTFNFTAYYSLNSFFNGKTIDQQSVDLSTIKVGLMFYML